MAGSRAPFVAVRTDIRKEERVRFIADHAGYNEDEAIGKLVRLWCWCTDRGLDDAPADCEGYAVPDAVVRRFMGPRGVEAILGDGCDELAMGARRLDGLIYLRGTSDTVDRLRSLRTVARSGGRSREANAPRDDSGRFVVSTTLVQLTDQPATSRPPAGASEIPDPRSQIQDPRSQRESSHAIAGVAPEHAPPAPPTVPPPAVTLAIPGPILAREDIARTQPAVTRAAVVAALEVYDHTNPRALGRLAETAYRRVSDARMAMAAELKLPTPIPFPLITPGSEPRGFNELRQRIREEGPSAPTVCDRVLANLIAQAREERSIDWLAEQVFGDKAWPKAKDWLPGAAARRRGPARGDPLPPAPPKPRAERPKPDLVLSDEDRAARDELAARLLRGNPDEVAADEFANGRVPAHLATAKLVRMFGAGGERAPPAPVDRDTDAETDEDTDDKETA